MSGGSYDYAFLRVNAFADELAAWSSHATTKESIDARAWFLAHLRLVAEAMRAIEWVDSGDYGPGDEVAAIKAVMDHGRADE